MAMDPRVVLYGLVFARWASAPHGGDGAARCWPSSLARTLWDDLLANDLVDEQHLIIGPIILSAGTPVFGARPAISLRLIDIRKWDDWDIVLVRYEVRRQKA